MRTASHRLLFTVCTCIIAAAVGFFGGYCFSAYTLNRDYTAEKQQYTKKISQLTATQKSDKEKLKETQSALEDAKAQLSVKNYDGSPDYSESSTDASAPLASPQANSSQQYLVKLYQNKPTIFDYTNHRQGDILTIINTNANALSQKDRSLLEKGVVVNSEEELAKILEDYSS